jgi:hypothetical protein
MEQLDRDILDWIAEKTADAALTAQIRSATVAKRDYMRTGFFVYFDVPNDAALVPGEINAICPHIDSPDLADGGGCSLFLRGGRLHYLEIYARGGFFPQSLERYELRIAD